VGVGRFDLRERERRVLTTDWQVGPGSRQRYRVSVFPLLKAGPCFTYLYGEHVATATGMS
jgi:hypothetical protein